MHRARWVLAVALVVSGCASAQRFVPASSVERAAGDASAAVVDRGGVTIVADAEAWNADPVHLPRVMTPMYVRIRNDSDREIAIRYQDFRLESDLGRTLSPMPPIAIDRAGPLRTAVGPVPSSQGFRLAPYYRDLFGEDTDYWTGGFLFDPYYYDRYAEWQPALPTEAMVERALPEGVLEPGGWVAGFVYFDRVEDDARRVTLHVAVDLPQGEERVATIEIPFVGVAI